MRSRPHPFDYACVLCFEETCTGCGVLIPEQTDEDDAEEEEEPTE